MSAMIREGDEVIIIEPCYDSYVPAIELNGGRAVFVELKLPEFKIDWNEVKKLVNFKPKMILINTPHNPTGSILSAQDLQKLEKIVRGTDVIICSDEVYEHMVFDKVEHQSVARFPALAERSFIISSFGKTYSTTGWKMGYCIAPEAMTKEFRKVHQFNCFTCFGPAQYALADFLKEPSHYLQLGPMLQKKRDHLMEKMQPAGLKPLPTFGSYFQLYSYEGISELDELSFAKKLTTEGGVATIPVSAFYSKPIENQVLRFCFAKKESTLDAAAERLVRYFEKNRS
jgi:methionine aminotransferase